MNEIPRETLAQLDRLIAEGLPVDQIAFMMRLSKRVVEERINTTKKRAALVGGSRS